MIESIVPALGPVLGAALLAYTSWRGTFWLLAAATLLVLLPPSQMGRASAMMVLAILLCGAVGTQVIAPFMDGRSPTPLAVGMLALCVVSAALVMPYPRPSPEPA